MKATLRHIYSCRTANMSWRTCVVVKQIQSNQHARTTVKNGWKWGRGFTEKGWRNIWTMHIQIFCMYASMINSDLLSVKLVKWLSVTLTSLLFRLPGRSSILPSSALVWHNSRNPIKITKLWRPMWMIYKTVVTAVRLCIYSGNGTSWYNFCNWFFT